MEQDPDTEFGACRNQGEEPPLPPVQIPCDRLSPAALEALVDAFVLREGTDYGEHEIDFRTKRQQVRAQLTSAKVMIVFDPQTESVTLMRAEDWERRQR